MRHETFQEIRIKGRVIDDPDIGVSDGSGNFDVQWTRSCGLYTIWVTATGEYATWSRASLLSLAIDLVKGQ